MDDKRISNEIIKKCNMGIVLLSIVDVIVILFFFITIAINIIAVICSSILVIIVTFLIIFLKKIKNNPLKYKKLFFSKRSDGLMQEQQVEMQRRQQIANEINKKYEFKTDEITFTEKDKLRIEKNCKVMENLGLPYMKEMKLVPLDSNVNIKTKEEIVTQMIFDFFVGHKAKNKLNNISDLQDMNVMSLAMKYPISEMFKVLGQISKGEIDDVTLNQIAYLDEQANVFAWALGFRKKTSETQLSDENDLYTLLSNSNGIDDLINKANMISNDEIKEYADLITRYEWAMIELKNSNKTSKHINVDCILEHKKATDFLTTYDPSKYLKNKKN